MPGNVILKVEVTREKLLESIGAVAPGQSAGNFGIEEISNEIISQASILSGESVTIDLQNYEIASAKEKTSLAVSKISLPAETTGVAELLEALGVITISPVSQFSLNQFMKEQEQLQADPVLLNMVASSIYEVFLKANFKVIERHISTDVPGKERIGYDVKISKGSNMDLVVFNPNEQEYNLELSIENSSLAVKLIGVPFTGNFEVTVETEEFKPKTIKRYNPLLNPDENKVEQEGKNGLLVTVTRKSLDSEGKLINTELISEDFYPPVHKIEISGLKPEPTNTAPNLSSPETIVLPGQDVSQGGTGSEQQDSGATPPPAANGAVKAPVNTGPEEDGNNADKDNQSGTGQDDGGIWGKPDEDEK
ncbi:G5 domain-containing protein [Mesobacillus subterraneus]|uniref:G5 domain-containing protein n=1 Tax=Mesobacillus subterraneus TaxID=285983 RepID=UPI00273E8C72|nr:G5 domain-containing protein [Mesobacillus subterraneus]WLR56183.1 G5 domain-containing protein [Mesobacillus subterraneus]